MNFLVIISISCFVLAAQAQYAPSGWKPQGARLALPTEYGPPHLQSDNFEVEISKENIEFAGQLGETTTTVPSTTTNSVEEEEGTVENGTEEAPVTGTGFTTQQQAFSQGNFVPIPMGFQQRQGQQVVNQPHDTYGAPNTK